ncbi:hypothetical protein NEHOM01_1412 [Nematocida homosporus]|uniref:uncharacterized protein n=1 Tax=Nematocida homosporus TaxID=1912981 RepID=UPI00221FC277|nr:uncharacterized protein NEHOM01_1412 [Nematocida homosporus]KAI5186358.1 hypothetical protein NEHOM01_1412 [Nematocida homosporus]
MKSRLTPIKELIPEIRRYAAGQIGGGETIRCLRDTLAQRGLKFPKRNIPYRHQKVIRERNKNEFEQERESLREQGIIIKRSRDKKEDMKRKRRAAF